MTEHIIIVRKAVPRGGQRPVRNDDVPEEWWENVWDLAPVPPRSVDHPAPYPEDLPHRLIRMLTNEGDAVLDPFNGAGATTKAAFDLGRLGVGFDLSEQYISYAKRRLTGDSSVRPQQLAVVPVNARDFIPGKSKGQTRHGAGLNARTRRAK
jgi:site-specific DNA-methyltransferase (adenine-specific)